MANFTPVFSQVSQMTLIKPGSPQFSFLPGMGSNSQIGESSTEPSLYFIFATSGDREITKIKTHLFVYINLYYPSYGLYKIIRNYFSFHKETATSLRISTRKKRYSGFAAE